MWRIILLALFSITAQAADIEKIFGSWTALAFYDPLDHEPQCLKVSFAKNPANVVMPCTNGNNATGVEVTIWETKTKKSSNLLAIQAVDNAEAVSLNTKCTFDDSNGTPVFFRLINPNLCVLYVEDKNKEFSAVVYSKIIPTAQELDTILNGIEDLKDKKHTVICTQANQNGFDLNE